MRSSSVWALRRVNDKSSRDPMVTDTRSKQVVSKEFAQRQSDCSQSPRPREWVNHTGFPLFEHALMAACISVMKGYEKQPC